MTPPRVPSEPRGDAVRRPLTLGPTGRGGPLSGTRLAVKEIVAVEGVPLSANTSLALDAEVCAAGPDAEIVRRLRAAGTSVVATTVSHELAWGITTWGRGDRVVNPHLQGRIAGGSSGGSASLVATGQVELAVGTDTAGSCRIPAAWCGTWGWKAGPDVVPIDRVLPLAPGLDSLGMFAVTGERLRSAVAVLGGGGVAVPRIEVPRLVSQVDERASRAVVAAAARLSATGHQVVDRTAPLIDLSPSELLGVFGVLQSAAALVAHREVLGCWPSQRSRYDPVMAERLAVAEQRPAAEVEAARARIARLRDVVLARLEGTVVLTVVTGCVPPSQRDPDHAVVADARRSLREVVLPHTVVANLVGLPAVAVPWWIDGEPVGVQLIGPPGSDLSLVELAMALGVSGDDGERDGEAPSG